jgi:hypothetical protein
VLAAVIAVIGLAVIGAAIVDHLHRDQIAPGSRIAGVPVGGLSKAAALLRLRSELLPRIERAVTVRVRHRTFRLTARQAGVKVDLGAMAAEALVSGRQGFFVTRAVDELTGAGRAVEVPLHVSSSLAVLAQFVASIAGAVDTAPVDAGLAYAASGIRTAPARPGRAVESARLRDELAVALTDPLGPRELAAPVRSVAARVTAVDLGALHPRMILVDRGNFTLRPYKHLRLAQT